MPTTALTLRERGALIVRALAGSLPTDPDSIGWGLLRGVIQPSGTPPDRTVKDVLNAYNTQPWLRAVCARISYDVAAVEWVMYAKKRPKQIGRGVSVMAAVRDEQVRTLQRAPEATRKRLIKSAVEAEDLTPINEHPMLDLLNNFNNFHVGLSGRRVTQQHIDLVGESFWLIERDGAGMPIALWPIPPSWIMSTPTVLFPAFRVSFRGWQGFIPATEFVWFSDLDPLNPYARGSGTAKSLADELETDEYAAKHVKAFFFNRARPDLIISPKNDDGEAMQSGEVRRMEQGWNARAQGFWKSFKPFFMGRAIDVKELDQNLRAQQFVQLRQFQRDTVIQVFGVSPEILGIVGAGANRATITIAEYIYGRRVLVPRLEFLRAVMQERLVPEFDERIVLDYVSPVTKDAELELDAAKAMPAALSIDEWRARMGEEPLPDGKGEVHLASPLLQPTNFDEPEEEPPLPPGAGNPADDGDDPDLPLNPAPPPGQPAPAAAAWDRFRR